MEIVQVVTLALLQGLTEFLPISSSAHLILAPHLFGWNDQGLAFDVAVHVGTLAAVVSYFRKEVVAILADCGRSLGLRETPTENARLGWMIALATLPVMGFGFTLKSWVETDFRSPFVIATATIGFGVLLWIFDLQGKRVRDEYSIGWRDALIIGLFQAIALVPGTSRSGITMTAGLMLGLTRQAASRFSFLLSIPSIFMSGGLVMLDLVRAAEPVDWVSLVSGAGLSFVTAYLCIHYFLKFIDRVGMLPFVLYRFVLGAVLLYIVLV